MVAALFQDPLLLLRGEGADLAFVGASFGTQRRNLARFSREFTGDPNPQEIPGQKNQS